MYSGRIGFLLIFLSFVLYNASGLRAGYNPLVNIRENQNTGIIALLLQKRDDIDDVVRDVESVDPPHDEKVYTLYHIMRMTQENEDLDEEAADKLEKTSAILRQALRKRCDKLDTCKRQCPKKKKYICTVVCQETYDDRDVCKPKTCEKKKCGTLPPSWL